MYGQRKDGAFTCLAGNRNIAAHIFRQTLRHGQTNPGSCGRFTAVAVLHLIIHGEDFILLILRNADPRIFNLEMQHIALVIARPHGHLSLLSELHGVADQIPQNLAQTRAVGNDLMR